MQSPKAMKQDISGWKSLKLTHSKEMIYINQTRNANAAGILSVKNRKRARPFAKVRRKDDYQKMKNFTHREGSREVG